MIEVVFVTIVIALVASVGTPVYLSRAARNRHLAERVVDLARQDATGASTGIVVRQLSISNADIARVANEASRRFAISTFRG